MKKYYWIALLGLLPIQVTHAEYTLPLVGESGSNHSTAQCRSGYLPVGLIIQAGTYVDSLYMLCGKRTSPTTVSYNTNYQVKVAFGYNPAGSLPGVSSTKTQKLCPNNYKITGIKFKGGDYVDRVVNMQCTKLRSSQTTTVSINAGGSGGTYQTRYCKSGTGIHKMAGTAGSWVNSVGITCK